MEAAKKRSDWIDYAKGVGIILALIGHAFRDQMFQVYPLFEFAKDMIYSFHMPMFFVLSGIAYAFFSENKQHSIGGFTGGKSKKILVPTLIYAALIYLVFFAAWQAGPLRQVLSRGGYEMVSPLKYLYLLFLEESPYCNHVWFALILFACQVIVFIIEDIYRKITGNKVFSARALFILEAVCLVLYYLIPLKFRMVMYLKFEIMYYIFGIIIVRLGMLNLRHEYSGLAVGVILCAVLKMTNYVTFPGAAIEVIEFIGYFIGAPLLILSIVLLCYKQNEERTAKQIEERTAKQIEGKDSAVRRLMLYLGRNSFVIYLLSQPLGAFIGIVMLKVLSVDPLTIFLIMTVSSVLSAVIPVIAVKLIGSFGPGQRVLELMNLKLS